MFQAFRYLLTVSFHRNFGRPLGRFPSIFISATARMFSVSPLLLTCPYHSSRIRLITVAITSTFASSKISSFLRCANILTPIAHRTDLISVVNHTFFIVDWHWPFFASVKQSRSNHCLIYQELQFCWNFLVADHSTQFSPFRPCLCHAVIHVFAGSSSSVYCWSKIFEGLDCWQVDHFCLYVHLFIITGSVSPVICRCLVFALLTLSPFFSLHSLHLSSLSSIISLSGSPNTKSSANCIAQGVPSSISSVMTSIIITNNSGLSAEPWWSPTSISISLVFPALVMMLVLHPAHMSRIIFM